MPGAVVERGERLTLRTAEREDVPFFQRAFAAPERRYPLGNVRPKNQDEVEARLEDDANTELIVCPCGGSRWTGRARAVRRSARRPRGQQQQRRQRQQSPVRATTAGLSERPPRGL
jgi:hypothetical protein